LKESLEKFGMVEPIIFNKQTGYIVGGHFRVRELKKLGIKEIECVIVDLNEADEKELNIRLNANTGSWDWDTLANDWEVVDLEAWGLEIPQFENEAEELEASEDDYDVPEGGIETDIVIGDLFEIGEHRLLCGDSTDSDAVARLMNGEKADLGHNDPPYGMKKENEGVLNDNLNYNDLLQFNREWIALQFTHLKDNGSFYCWGTDEPLMDIYSEILKPYIREQKATFRNLITWNKSHPNTTFRVNGFNSPDLRSFYASDEKCLFVMCGVQGFNNNADNYFEGFEILRDWLIKEKQKSGLKNEEITNLTATTHTHYWSKSQWSFPTKEHYNSIKQASNGKAFIKEYEEIKKEYEEIKKEYEEIKKEYYSTRAYFDNTHDKMKDTWNFEITSSEERENTGGHATPKPIPLCERVIKSSCPEKGLVIDVFLGSGSTMVAAHQLKRRCYGMELEPKYCAVIIDRMAKLDPSLKITRNGKEYKKTA
jgi:DNA modification methylase